MASTRVSDWGPFCFHLGKMNKSHLLFLWALPCCGLTLYISSINWATWTFLWTVKNPKPQFASMLQAIVRSEENVLFLSSSFALKTQTMHSGTPGMVNSRSSASSSRLTLFHLFRFLSLYQIMFWQVLTDSQTNFPIHMLSASSWVQGEGSIREN